MTIPARLHFCWIGSRLSWAYVFAVLSAAERSEMAEIVLHHTEPLEEGPELRALQSAAGVRLDLARPASLLAETGARLGLGGALVALYERLADPVMRSDILRVAILDAEGGIYADLDTITVASLQPLLDAPAFVGTERIVWPAAARISRSPFVLGRHLGLDVVRKVFKLLPGGWRHFRRLEGVYSRGVNNAIMGAEAGSSVMAAYLHAMVALLPARQGQRYGLGPPLLGQVASAFGPDALSILSPAAFSPLPPEISEHWFRDSRRIRLTTMLSGETRIVHWYASVRTQPRIALIDPDYIRQHHRRQPYSALVFSCIPGLSGAA